MKDAGEAGSRSSEGHLDSIPATSEDRSGVKVKVEGDTNQSETADGSKAQRDDSNEKQKSDDSETKSLTSSTEPVSCTQFVRFILRYSKVRNLVYDDYLCEHLTRSSRGVKSK